MSDFPILPEEQVTILRSLTADLDPGAQVMSDAQLQGFLALYGGNYKRAAARALRTIAASEVLLAKKITTQDLSTDGPAVSAELRALADDLVREADAEDAQAAESEESYVFVPNGPGVGVEGEERGWVL